MSENLIISETTNIILRQVNKNTNEVINKDILTCNNVNYLKISVNYAHNSNRYLNKALLKLPLLSYSDLNFKICVITQDMGGVISYGDPITYSELLTENNVNYVVFDIANLFLNTAETSFDLIVTPSSGTPSMQIYGNLSSSLVPKFVLYEIKYDEKVERMPVICNNLSNFVNYRMNLLHSCYRIIIPLINLNLGETPLNLNLVYTDNYINNNVFNHWMFSYNQYLYQVDLETYHYIDGNGDKHIFKLTNNENVFQDKVNRNLFLNILEDKFIVTDKIRNELEFDSSGKLKKLKFIKSDGSYKNTLISYNNEGKIIRVEDDLFRMCDFFYLENQIIVRYSNLREIKIELNNGYVESIEGLVTDQTKSLKITNKSNLIEDNTEILTDLIEQIKTPFDEFVTFNYYETGFINEIIHYNNPEKLYTNKIKRTKNQIIISNYEYEYNEVSSINFIDFNDSGSLIKTFDDVFGTIQNIQTYPNDKNIRSQYCNSNSKISYIEFEDYTLSYNYINVFYYNSSVIHNLEEINLNTLNENDGQVYEIDFSYSCDGPINYYKHNNSYIEVYLEIKTASNTYYERFQINDYKDGKLYGAMKSDLTLPLCDNLIIKGHVLFYNFAGRIKFNPIVLSPKIKIKHDCLNHKTNTGYDHFYEFNVDNKKWYSLTNVSIKYKLFGEDEEYRIENVVMNIKDYFLTLQSYYNKEEDEEIFDLHYNDGDCILGVTQVIFDYDYGQIYNISDCQISTINTYFDKTQIQYYSFLANKRYKITNKIIYNNGKCEFVERTYDYYDNLLTEKDQFNITKNNSYLSNGELSETIIYNSSGGLNYKRIVTAYDNYYTSDKYISTTNELLCFTQNEEAAISTTVRSDIDTGNVSSIIKPNDHIINYSYNINEGYMSEINTSVNNEINKNNISKTEDYIVSYNHNNITYNFNYDNKGFLENVDYVNNDLIYYYYSHTLNKKMRRTNFVDESYYDETFDKFGRLIKLEDVDYGNISYTYSSKIVDELDSDEEIISTPNDKLRKIQIGDKTTKYYYDLHDYTIDYDYSTNEKYDNVYGNLTKEVNDDYTSTYGYDTYNRLKRINLIENLDNNKDFINSITYNYNDTETYRNDIISKKYFKTSLLNKNNVNDCENYDYTLNYEYDYLNRINKVCLNKGIDINNIVQYEKEYLYCSGQYLTSNYVRVLNHKLNDELFDKEEISYNNLKCVSSIKYKNDNNKIINYTYDSIGRLIKEENKILNFITVYEYDQGGNIISKKSCPYTNSLNPSFTDVYLYEYHPIFKDKLLNIKHNNDPINIIHYDNYDLFPSSCYKYYYHWGSQHKLIRLENKNMDSFIISNYDYYPTGLRKEKEVSFQNKPNNKYQYIYQNNNLIQETVKKQQEDSAEYEDYYKLIFTYDNNNITGFYYYQYNDNIGHYYMYVRDTLGNIKYILDDNLYPVCKYEYDAWGNHKVYRYNNGTFIEDTSSSFIGNINPIRYKGYYYDVETEFFYCNSRYYSPELCRWISPDSIEYLDPESINGLNLYCYCYNNPISYSDPSGNLPQWAKWAIGAGVIAILAVATVLTAGAAGVGVGAAFAAGFAGSAIGVGASGLAVTIAGSAFAGAVIGAGCGLIGGALVGGISSGSWSGALEGAANGFMMGSITGAISGGIRGGINYARTSPLIRSVSADELNSIKSTGQFSSSGYSESKWFATNSTDASKWANWFGQSDYVGIRVPKSAFKNFYFDPVLDNIGPAYNIEIGYLNSILKGIWYF